MGTPASNTEDEGSLRYFGWRVVLAANLGVMVGFGSLLVYTFSVFLKPLTGEFGWSREAVSRAFGMSAMAVALSSPLLGKALDRFSPRRIILPCVVVFGTAFASLSLLTANLWHLYGVFLVLGIVGNATTQMGYSGAIASWFKKQRGLAFAVVMAGGGLGSILLPMATQSLIASFGWRMAYLILGGLVLAVGLPLSARYLRRKNSEKRVEYEGATVGEALRQRSYWILVATLFLSSIAVNGAITHLVALLTDRGFSAGMAAVAASALGGANFLGRLMTGALLDRFFGPRIAFGLLTSMAGGILLLARASKIEEGILAAVLIGFGLGGEADVTPYLLTRYFGLRAFSTLYGLSWTFYAMAGALGPAILGRVFDLTQSYTVVLSVMAMTTLVSAILMLWMPRYKPE